MKFRKSILALTAGLAVLASGGSALAASAAPAVHVAKTVHVLPASCSNTMTGEAYPKSGNYAGITVDTNTCNRELRAVAECWNGSYDYYNYSGGVYGVHDSDFIACNYSDSLQASGCQVHYGSGWSDIFIKWIAGQKDPNPYPCP